MKASRFGAVTLLAALLVVGWSSSAQAQAAGGGQRGQRGQQGGRGNFDPAQAREQYMTRLKEQLGATDEEWKALQPKVTKVMDARRDNRGGGGGRGGPGGPGGRRGGNNGADQTAAAAQPTTAVGQAEADLRKTVEDKSAAPEEINKKLAALREAREKAKSELTAAQKELKDLLSARQEAILVTNGLLE
jgi:hypothetical protein